MVFDEAREDAAIQNLRNESRQLPGFIESLRTRLQPGEISLAAEAAILIAGDYCHMRERGSNICGSAKRAKVNSAGVS